MLSIYNGYYDASKNVKILQIASTWIKLEDIMLNETSQKDKQGWFY